jgi:hypothetical protein
VSVRTSIRNRSDSPSQIFKVSLSTVFIPRPSQAV